jgi:hypothetical protein
MRSLGPEMSLSDAVERQNVREGSTTTYESLARI